MTSHPLYMTPFLGYFCHHIHSIDDVTPTVFMRSHPLYMLTSYPLYTTTYSLYLYHHSHCTCVSHLLFPWYHTLCIYDISPTIFDTTATASVWSYLLYWSAITKLMEIITIGTCMTLYTVYIISHSHFITSMLSIYDIKNTSFMTSDLLYMTSHPFFRTSDHFMYDINSTVSDIMSTVSVSSHPPYWWHHSHYMDGITSSISVTSYPLYLWNNIH